MNLDDSQIIEAVNEVFVEEFEIDPGALAPDANIFMNLGLDSLDVVDLIVALQKKFGVKVRNDERVRSVRTLADLYEYLKRIRDEQVADGQ